MADAAACRADGAGGGSIDALLLDAYDSEGRVPAHLQAERFVRDAAAALSPGGVVVANLFDSSEVARAESKAFGRRLRDDVGPVYALRVVGHEANIILLAIKRDDEGPPTEGPPSTPCAAVSPPRRMRRARSPSRRLDRAVARVHAIERGDVPTL